METNIKCTECQFFDPKVADGFCSQYKTAMKGNTMFATCYPALRKGVEPLDTETMALQAVKEKERQGELELRKAGLSKKEIAELRARKPKAIARNGSISMVTPPPTQKKTVKKKTAKKKTKRKSARKKAAA